MVWVFGQWAGGGAMTCNEKGRSSSVAEWQQSKVSIALHPERT